jgi:hypothetical protein
VPFTEPFTIDEGTPYCIFSSRHLRFPGCRPIHTYADPFLFVHGSELFIFLEVQELGRPGWIEGYATTDLKQFHSVGPIFRPRFHVSYPQVFAHDGEILMIPETSEARELSLFQFGEFPFGLRRITTLLEGEYCDATLLREAGRWWLFATTSGGLEIHHSRDLCGPYIAHRCNPIATSAKTSRCGGPFLRHDNDLLRLAQDGSRSYGDNLTVLRVSELTEEAYREEIVVERLFECRQKWNRRGGHHLSTANFLGQEIAAIDGKQADFWANRALSLLARMTS